MILNITNLPLKDLEVEVLGLPIFSGISPIKGEIVKLDKALGGEISRVYNCGDITGNYKEFTIIYTQGSVACKRLLFVGLGEKEKFNSDRLRSVVAIMARNCRRLKKTTFAIYAPEYLGLTPHEFACIVVEGIELGLYKFTRYIQKDWKGKFKLSSFYLWGKEGDQQDLKEGLKEGQILAKATNWSRDLVNEPPNILTPTTFAIKVKEKLSSLPIKVEVFNEKEIKKLGMYAFLAVAKGSGEPPCFVKLTYQLDPDLPLIALIGKGVTFDSGGLDLKNHEQQQQMKGDMAGGASVAGAIMALAEMKVKANVVGLIPLCENLPGNIAYKIGDIITTKSGKTVEVMSTDSEGRLLLADAITFAKELKASVIIDIATLTGGIITALGHQTSGIMGNSSWLIKQIIEAGLEEGEYFWELPLFDSYLLQLKSNVADIRGDGGRPASPITAGMFLKEFVDSTTWAHLDIAGTALVDEAIMLYLKNPYFPKEGGTGVGVRTLYRTVKKINVSLP